MIEGTPRLGVSCCSIDTINTIDTVPGTIYYLLQLLVVLGIILCTKHHVYHCCSAAIIDRTIDKVTTPVAHIASVRRKHLVAENRSDSVPFWKQTRPQRGVKIGTPGISISD